MSIVVGQRTVTWTATVKTPALLQVTRSDLFPPTSYNWFSFVLSNGNASVTFPFASAQPSLIVGQVTTGANPVPGGPNAGKSFSASVQMPGNATAQTAVFSLQTGTWDAPTLGVLTITAECDVIYDLVDLGECVWAERGFWRDMPNDSRAVLRLRLRDAAQCSMALTGNATPLTSTMGTAGDILDNHLQVTAMINAISTSAYKAHGAVDITCDLGSYWALALNKSDTYAQGTVDANIAPNHIDASAEGSTNFTLQSEMSCSYSLERTADLVCGIYNTAGEGMDADVSIPRYYDDDLPTSVSASGGTYSEAITQRAWSWTWSASSTGGGSSGDSGSWSNWGDFGCSLGANWLSTEQPNLPSEWGPASYVQAKDIRLPLHTWWSDDLVSITNELKHDTHLGYSNQYTESGGQLTAQNSTPLGLWKCVNGSIELDVSNNAILIKPSSGCKLTRTIAMGPTQCGENPTSPPREAWAGYRWLEIAIEPVDPATGLALTRVGDGIAASVKQDNMQELWPDPGVQTWSNGTLETKRYSAVTKSASGVIIVDIDLANPVSPKSTRDGGNPPAAENYGADAVPNVLSRYPEPTLDAVHGGVTNACQLDLELPSDVWWRLRAISLHHAEGTAPVISLLPAWNQWIRSLRMDKHDEADESASKDWRKRMMVIGNEGLLGPEGFDINRHSTRINSEELGVYDNFTWSTINAVDGILAHLTEVQQLSKWEIVGGDDVYTDAGAIRKYPGWSYSIQSAAAGSIDEHMLTVGCYLGGRGITWTGATPTIWHRQAMGTLVVQALAGIIDWFGGVGDVFGLNEGDGPLQLRACSVLRGAAYGLGIAAQNYELLETGSASTVDSCTADAHNGIALDGGKANISHIVRHSSGNPAVTWDNTNTITWLYRPSLLSGSVIECVEAPCWWHVRGVHWSLFSLLAVAMQGIAYAVSQCGRGAKAQVEDGAIKIYIARDINHADWLQMSGVTGTQPAMAWTRNANDALIMLSSYGDIIEQRISKDFGGAWNVSTVASGTHPAVCLSANGAIIQAWCDSDAIKLRIVDSAGSVLYGPITAVASGVDDDAIAIGERMVSGRPAIVMLYRSSGDIHQITSYDNGKSWAI